MIVTSGAEFLVANLQIYEALTEENLRQAFDFFDEVSTTSNA